MTETGVYGFIKQTPFLFRDSGAEVKCVILDKSALITIDQEYWNHRDQDTFATYRFPDPRKIDGLLYDLSIVFPNGKVDGLYVEEREISGGNLNSDIPLCTLKPGETVRVTTTYKVDLLIDADTDELKLVVSRNYMAKHDIDDCFSSKPVPVPEWDMPVINNPPSLYNRAKTDDPNSVGRIIFTDPNRKGQATPLEKLPEQIQKEKQKEQNLEAAKMRGRCQETAISVFAIFTDAPIKHAYCLEWSGDVLEDSVSANTHSATFRTKILSTAFVDDFELLIIKDSPLQSRNHLLWIEKGDDVENTKSRVCRLILNEEKAFDLDNVKEEGAAREFILLLDRNQSLSDEEFAAAKKTLTFVLMSLPMNCTFNVYGFSSETTKFFECSKSYDHQHVQQAKKLIESMMKKGDSSIHSVYAAVNESSAHKDTAAIVFTNFNERVPFCQSLVPDVPIHCIGFGKNISERILTCIANKTGTVAEFVSNLDNLDESSIKQLRRCMVRPLKNICGIESLPPGRNPLFFVTSTDEIEISCEKMGLYTKELGKDHALLARMMKNAENEYEETFVLGDKCHVLTPQTHIKATMQRGNDTSEPITLSKRLFSKENRQKIQSLSPDYGDDDELEEMTYGGKRQQTKGKTALQAERKTFFAENFDKTVDGFINIFQHDGKVSFSDMQKQWDGVPQKTNERISDDDWATLLWIAYMTINEKSHDMTWKLILQKSLSSLSKNLNPEILTRLYQEVLEATVNQ